MTSQESTLRLFLSVDVVGSTKFKNQECKAGIVQPWYEFFRDFYQEFPEFLSQAVRALSNDNSSQRRSESPRLWKSIGDELIFMTELKCHVDALYYVHAFQLAIKQYKNKTAKKTLPLGFKGAAWVAGFPIINAEIQLPHSSGQNDFIGPQIDGGFRLSQLANERKFIISIELALLLSQALQDEANHFNWQFFFDGRHILKGVLNDKPYPILWVDMDNGKGFEDESVLGNLRNPIRSHENLTAYCREFIAEQSPRLVVPYILTCQVFNVVDPAHQALLEQFASDPQELLSEKSEEPSSPEAGDGQGLDEPIFKAVEGDIPLSQSLQSDLNSDSWPSSSQALA